MIVWKEQEEEENRSNIMVFAMYNFALLTFASHFFSYWRSWPTTCRKFVNRACVAKVGEGGAPLAERSALLKLLSVF